MPKIIKYLTYQNRAAVTDLLIEKSIVKGGEVSRVVPINRDGWQARNDFIDNQEESYWRIPLMLTIL